MNKQQTKKDSIPVITIDGPSGSGKGTVSLRIARLLDWHFLDSGAIYRALALAVIQERLAIHAEAAIEHLALGLDLRFSATPDHTPLIFLHNENISEKIRTEECGKMASQIAGLPGVRAALLARQRAFLKAPGLIADGRDMGTVVFPDALLKIFLDASPQERAKRRYKQLQAQKISVNLEQLISELVERDARDRNRLVSPLKSASDAVQIDTTHLTIEQVVEVIMKEVAQRIGYLPHK